MPGMFSSLRAKLLTATLAVVATGFTVTIGVMSYQSYNAVLEQGDIRAKRTAELAAKTVSQHLDQSMTTALGLRHVLEGLRSHGTADRDSVNAILRRQLDGNPALLGLFTGWEPGAFDDNDEQFANTPGHDASGRLVPYWNRGDGNLKVEPLVDYDQTGAGDYYQVPKRTGQPFVSDPYEYEVGGRKMLIASLVQPVMIRGRFYGIAGADIALDAMSQWLGDIKPFGVGYVTILSQSGLVVYGPERNAVGRTASTLPAPALAALARGEEYSWLDDEGISHFLERIEIQGAEHAWGAIVSVPREVITESADQLLRTAIVLGLLSLVLTAAVIFTLLTALTRPLNQLAKAMEDLAGGEGDLTRRLDIRSDDELGRVAGSVNAFLTSLQRMFLEVRDQSNTLEHGLRTVTNATQQVAGSSRTLADTSSSNAATVEQVTVSIGHIAEHAREADETMLQTSAVSQRSAAAVRAMEQQMQGIGSTMEGLAGSLGGLEQRSGQIAGVAQVIREIADQTNLLALNAAIEAARAGEQGRGFAVVADEVRKLAERTGSATLEIRATIESIRNETQAAVDGMKQARNAVDAGMLKAQEVAGEIGSIEAQMDQAAGRVREIAEATQEQSSATTQLAQSIEQASSMVQATDAAIQDASSTIDELGRTAERLGQLVGRFRL
ncbi:methyl-accepting chemotaxis protein [Parazoarcus communis]|uniref:Methyl-accepting chemotaxis protein n=2 Tax=root TaxID=1 RepID=A0A323UX67_9RHOO|nr:methyl-accepting chemotaxis protein [Parazoarcus communis]NMG68963.1 HAMP domain-containing protein [Parazoarcus communis SWub3 = DSM 12120]PZA16831.1 methyl-accepting chemotaxis protein [Azoarcus communis] [Parazoarcus communis SWub3 = DSM 12120]